MNIPNWKERGHWCQENPGAHSIRKEILEIFHSGKKKGARPGLLIRRLILWGILSEGAEERGELEVRIPRVFLCIGCQGNVQYLILDLGIT